MNQDRPSKQEYRLIKSSYHDMHFLEVRKVSCENGKIINQNNGSEARVKITSPSKCSFKQFVKNVRSELDILNLALEKPILDSETLKEIE